MRGRTRTRAELLTLAGAVNAASSLTEAARTLGMPVETLRTVIKRARGCGLEIKHFRGGPEPRPVFTRDVQPVVDTVAQP